MDRPRSQFLSRDAGGKAKIIFYLRARSGLAARRFGFNHQSIQSLRCGIHGGSKSGWTGSHDNYIANAGILYVGIQTQALGHFLRGRILQYSAPTDQHDWYFVELHVEMVEEFLRKVVFIQVEKVIGISIASQKLAQAQRVPRMVGTDYR